MTYGVVGREALDYRWCRYGSSKLRFRGPKRALDAPYAAFVGGTETFGKFIDAPYPDLVERHTGLGCVNFGVPGASTEAFVNDQTVLTACRRARITVVEVTGAQNLSNRFYTVHPRRNDRFLRVTPLMRRVFGDMDFSGCHFTGHLLRDLHAVAPERAAIVRQDLRETWVQRMGSLLKRIGGPVVLLWFAGHGPDGAGLSEAPGTGPALVDRVLLDRVAPLAQRVIEVTPSDAARGAGTDGMVFDITQARAAAELLGPTAHQDAARALIAALPELAR